MTWLEAIIYGLIQGLSEFLPGDFGVATLIFRSTYINVRLAEKQLCALKSPQTGEPEYLRWNLRTGLGRSELVSATVPEGTRDKCEPKKEEHERQSESLEEGREGKDIVNDGEGSEHESSET